jgi:excisionase family DNA binding protein
MSKNNGITRFYTKQEVAEILRVSVKTVTRYMSYGLPYKKIRRSVRIPEDEFLKWLREKEEL